MEGCRHERHALLIPGTSTGAPGCRLEIDTGLPRQRLLKEDLGFINMGTCLEKTGEARRRTPELQHLLVPKYTRFTFRGRPSGILGNFLSHFIVQSAWVASGEPSIKTQVHGETGTRGRGQSSNLSSI